MSCVQVPFARETMAISTTSWIGSIVRRVTGIAIGIQRPVGDPHLGVGSKGIDHPAGGTVAIRPAAGVMEIMHGIPRTTIHVMTSRGAAAALVPIPQRVYAARMAAYAVATTGRDTGLQVRNGGMAEAAVAIMGDIDRLVVGPAGIVAARAGCPVPILNTTDGHIAGSNMGSMRHCLVGMTRQTVGRVGRQRDGVDHLLPRAVVTGGAGAGPDIVLRIDFRPVRHGMTASARCTTGQVCGSQCNGMPMVCMQCFPAAAMAGGTVAKPGLADGRADQGTGIGVMTTGTGVMRIGCYTD